MKNYNRSLLVLKYLHNQTDEDHLASIKDINSYLYEYQLDGNRETIVDCIKELQEAGYDICCVRSTQNRYYMHSRPFTLAEVKLLVDAVQSSRFISEQQSREIIEKLASIVGTYKGDILKRQLYIGSRAKAENLHLSEYIEKIHTAITQNKKISFRYYDYDANKNKVLRRDGQSYVFSPFTLIWNNDMYYVVGCGDYYKDKVLKFRPDRMEGLEIVDEERVPTPESYDVSDFFEREFSMMAGELCEVELLCENKLMGSVVDKFGENVKTAPVDEEHFKVTVDVKLSSLFYAWVFASAGRMKIVSPSRAVNDFRIIALAYLKEDEELPF